MARKQKRRAPRKFKGIRVVPAIEALAQATIWTEATLKVNPIEFLTGVVGGNFGTYAANLPEAIVKNIGGMEGLVMTGLKSAGLAIGFRIFGKLTRKARSGINTQILKPFGINEFVRF